nr:Unknown Function [uncultured bacterium]
MAALIALAAVGTVGGILMGIAMEVSTASHILGGEYYWSAVLAGNALVLGLGWAMLALWQLGSSRWAMGAVLGGVFALLAALIGGIVTDMGVELKMSFLVVAAIPALLAGLWLARAYGGASNRQLGLYLGIGVGWLLIGLLLALMLAGRPTPNKAPLPDSILLWIGEILWWGSVPLVLAWPLLATAFSALPEGTGRRNGLLLFAAGFLVLPVALAGFFAVTLRLIP